MKKIIFSLLVVCSLFSVSQLNVSGEEKSLEINSKNVSILAEEYGKENFSNMLDAFLMSEKTGEGVSNFTLGSPFTIVEPTYFDYSNIYFPIINEEGKIIYVYTVSSIGENNFIGSISKFMADDLENVKENGSDSPITIYSSNKDIYVEQDNTIEVLSELNTSNENEELEIAENTDILHPVDFLSETDIEQSPIINSRAVLSGKDYVSINFKVREVQGKNSWCAAVALTNILANKNTPIYTSAKAIIDYTHPKLSEDEKKDRGVSDPAIVKYAQSKGLSPKLTNSRISNTEVKNNIKNGNAVYMHMAGVYYEKPSRHAMAITGWAVQPNNQELFWVSNPWHDYTTMTYAGSGPITVTVPGGYFTWSSTVSNL